jgi:tetratricopeptide (TPR) repeat protein
MTPRAATLAVAFAVGWSARAPGQAPPPFPTPAPALLAPERDPEPEPAVAPGDAPELAVVRLYRDGRHEEAVAALENTSEAERAAELEALRLVNALPDAGSGDLVRASVLLHTDRATLERARLKSGIGRPCGLNDHDTFARSVAKLMLVRKDGRAFVQRWFRAVALASQRDLCGGDVAVWTKAGLEWFPKDASLYLVRGTAAETEGTFAPTLDLVALDRGDENSQAYRAERALRLARQALGQAVTLDPELHEARLRLGRTLWLLGDRPGALSNLERVARESQAPLLAYLSQLFLARVYAGGGRFADAERAYRAALAAQPGSQAAVLGLAELQARRDGIAATRPLVVAAVAHAPRKDARDPYWSYAGAFAGGGEKELAALRAELAP